MLVRHEGLRTKPYRDTVGKLTIGVGRNLDDVGISEAEALVLLDTDINHCFRELTRALPFFGSLSSDRQNVLIDMAINLGVAGLLGFKKMIRHLEHSDFKGAASEMLDSKWARQNGARATELSEMMRDEAHL
jgi:lysozyme